MDPVYELVKELYKGDQGKLRKLETWIKAGGPYPDYLKLSQLFSVQAVRFAEGRVRCSGYRVQEGGGRRMAEASRHEGPPAQRGARRRHSVYK